MRRSLNVKRIGYRKHHTNPTRSREVPPSQTKQALKVLKAHNKFGTDTLSPTQLDEIPGLEILDINTVKIS
jgi:hypothetical protein